MTRGVRFNIPGRQFLIAAAFIFAAVAFAVTTVRADHIPPADTFTGLKKADPRESKLKPGLGVTYYFNKFNAIDELMLEAEISKGEKGKPIPQLNYHVGQGKVLTSDRENLVGAIIYGFIKLSKKGVYTFLLQSNDGVVLRIAGKELYTDPVVHPDDYSPPITVKIDDPGWYEIGLDYFEKKNTSTLELYWKQPGDSGDPVFVPTDAFAHIPKR